VLLVDADEEISDSLAKKIKEIVNSPAADYYRIARKSIIFGKWIKSAHWWPDYVYRLFKKGSVTWEDTIHSVPFTKGTGQDLPAKEEFSIIHHHYTSISQYIDRLNRYTDHQVKHLQDGGYSFTWKDLINKPLAEFFTQYFARRAYAEGIHGLALSCLQSFSELVLILKMWQVAEFVPSEIGVAHVHEILGEKAQEYKWWHNEAQINQASWLVKPWLRLKRKLHL
jgi:(heptosyl)LPS beta-1,4-glucosyltransferase